MADMTRVSMSVRGAEVVTVPIDDTLTIAGQAADAKATGDALALKADKSELQAAVKVNNQPADAQGLILIDGRHIPVSDEDAETLAEAVTDLKGQTAENIPMSSDSGAKTIAEVVNANTEAIENMEEMTGATMPIESGSQTTVKAAIEARVKTVNQKAPDTDGNVDLSVVPLAENLQSDKMQSVDGTFITRTTGGSSSVSDGKAYPQHILGTSERTGYVAEVLNMTVIPIERTEPDEPITATIDRDVFVAYVDESGTINLYYTTEWSEDPELYGVTVEGTPVAGDQIQIVYVKEERGTILVSNPGRLVGTGWNLFNFNAGYARVVRYSDEYGYKIGGVFTSIEYSATPEGDRVSILPGQNGLFQVPGDGYMFVSGGNATDTYILATWSDWTDGPATGYWEAYKESGIDLSAVMGTYFPYGMLSVGTIHDEIDLSAKRTISRVERMAYTAENLEAAIETGREYTYDTNYIYLERAEYVISAITIDTVYNVSEHGLEWFTGTTMPLITEILYGKNLRDKLERDVLTISKQTLAEEEKAQVRRNIGVMDPPTNGNGTLGQLLKTNGDGTTEWTTQGTPTDAQVGTAVSAWLTAHPEATTTVEDGAISRAKLNDDLKAKTDAVPDLLSLSDYTAVTQGSSFNDYTNIGRYGSASNAIAQTITDGPKQTMTGFLLVVEAKNSAKIQTVVDNNNTMYRRKYNNSTGTWTSWVTYAFTSDIPNIDNTLSIAGAVAGAKATGDAIKSVDTKATEVKSAIKSYTGIKNLAVDAIIEEGYYYTNAGVKTSSANYANCVITEGIETGKRIWVTSEIHNTSANLGFVTCLDSNNSAIAYATSTGVFYKSLTKDGIVYVTQILTVPTGTVKICINRLSTNYAAANSIEQYVYAGFEGAYCKESALYPNGSIHIDGVPTDILVGPTSDILNNIGKNVNVRNRLVCAPGMYIKYNTGEITSKDTFKMYFPIPTEYISAIQFTGTYASSVGHKGAFLDANLDYISGFSVDVARSMFPSGAKYVVLNDVVDSTTDFNILITFTNTFGSDGQNPYMGLNGVAFGTSLTAKGGTGSEDNNYGYLDYLPTLSEMTWVNDGVSSSTIVGTAPSTILNHILNYADFATKQVVIIEGFVNDWATDIDVGTYTDTTNETVCGCLHLAIDHIKQINGNISIFVLLDHVGQSTCAPTVLHNNKTQYEFYEECKKCAEFHGVKVIREYAESDISVYSSQYLQDQIHLNAKGSQQSAQFIWREMRRFEPNVI